MADGLLSGLESFGFGGLENMNLFEDESKKSAPQGDKCLILFSFSYIPLSRILYHNFINYFARKITIFRYKSSNIIA